MPLTLLSAGSNAQGQLGHSLNEDSHTFRRCTFQGCAPGSLPTGTSKIVNVATGANHTVVLLEIITPTADGEEIHTEVWGCGDGQSGQLGPRYKSDRLKSHGESSRTDVFRKLELPLAEKGLEGYSCKMIAAGWNATYLVFSPPRHLTRATSKRPPGDVVLSMGSKDWGDLGVETKSTFGQGKMTTSMIKHAPTDVYVVNIDPVLLNSATYSAPEPLVVQSIAANQNHVLVHVRCGASGFIAGWGAARHGQLCPSPTDRATLPSTIRTPELTLSEDINDPFVSIRVGAQHSVLLKSSGSLMGMGSNRKGQLNFSPNGVHAADCTWNGTYATVLSEESAYGVRASGSNTHGQLGVGSSGSALPLFPDSLRRSQLTKLACGTEHVLTLWKSPESIHPPEVWAWGWNEHGNLGLGTRVDAHVPVKIFPFDASSLEVVDIWGGSGTSWLCCKEVE